MNQSEILIDVIKKYKFHKPVSIEIQKRILKSKARTLKTIFKTEKEDSLFRNLVIPLYFFVKKLGIAFSYSVTSNIVRVISFALLSIIIASAIFTVNSFIREKTSIIKLPDQYAITTFATGNVEIYHPDRKTQRVKIKDIIRENETIKTGIKSNIIIQINNIGTIQILSNSEVSVNSASIGGCPVEVTIIEGQVFSNILKLKSGAYRVKTPTSVITVQGTEFMTSYKKGRVTIELLRGSLSFHTMKSPDREIFIKEKQIVKINKQQEIRIVPMTKIRQLYLERLSLYSYIEDIQKKNYKEIQKHILQTKEKEIKIDKEISRIQKEWDDLPPLEKLRRQGKPLFMLYMRDGSKIAGSIVDQNKRSIKLDTGDGVIDLPKKEIVKRVPLQ